MYRMIMGLAVALTIGASVSGARATSLDFIGGTSPGSSDANCIENGLPNCYGDHVSASPNGNGSTIGQGNAFTPKIGAAYSGNLRVWTNGFGADAYLGSGDNVHPGYFTLTADPGFQIKLNSVTLDIDSGSGTVDLLSGGPSGTFLQSLAVAGHANPTLYTLNLIGTQFTLVMGSWNWGVRNVNFDQVAATTPLPAGVVFFTTGLGGIAFAGWRRRKAISVA